MDVSINREQETTTVIVHADEGIVGLGELGQLAATELWDGAEISEYRPKETAEVEDFGVKVVLQGVFGRRDLFKLMREAAGSTLPPAEQVITEAMVDVHLPD